MKVDIIKRERGTVGPSIFVHATRDEALSIIASLSAQLLARSPNAGRVEHRPCTGADYLSIAVEPEVDHG